VDELPESKARRAAVDVAVAAAVVEKAGRVLFVRRAEGKLLGRMWEIPQTSLESKGYPDLVREMKERHGLEIEPRTLVARARHAITFRRIRAEAWSARLLRRLPDDPDRFAWADAVEARRLPMSSLSRKLLHAIEGPQLPLAMAEDA
jgi:adenine-specific DNA glycosylase